VQAIIENLAPLPRDQWTRCAVPKAEADQAALGDLGQFAQFRAVDGRVFPAVRGRTVREHSTVFRVLASMNGSETLLGEIEPTTIAPWTFTPHPWVSDDVAELVPEVLIARGGKVIRGGTSKVTLVDQSPAHQRWHVKRVLERGFVLEWWAEVRHLDPVVECWGKLVWSDRSDPNEATRVEGIALRTGELFYDYFAKRKGMGQPIAAGSDWWVPVSGARNFVDGAGIDFFGQMLCHVSDPSTIPESLDLELDNGWIAWSIRSLVAAGTSRPVVASGIKAWRDGFLANDYLPRIDAARLDAEFQQEWSRFEASLGQAGDFYDDRPHGIGQKPGWTGDKEGFGATKGTYVVVGERPRALHMLAYSVVADLYRPGTSLYDEAGEPLDPTTQTDWWTWSGYTHYHPGVSPNRLGKTASSFGWPNLGATGWDAYDDQHRGQLNLCAVLALWDDPLAESIVRTQSIPDAAMLLGRVGATRAVGRLCTAWSNFVGLLEDGLERQRFETRIAEKLQNVTDRSSLNVPGPVKVIHWIGPDNRKQVYDPTTGALAPSWSCWEAGLAAVGLAMLLRETDDPVVRRQAGDALRTLCTTVVDWGLFQEGGQYYLCNDVAWVQGGQALPATSYALGSKQLVVSPGIGGTTGWAFCAVLIATEVLPDGPTRDKARAAVRHFTGNREATSRRTAEWWACVSAMNL
jgi:hypothetical protein